MTTITEPMVKIDPRFLKKYSLEELQTIVNLYLKYDFEQDNDLVEF
jgi:hypothetical protein